MKRSSKILAVASATLTISAASAAQVITPVTPDALERVGTIDERFLSYNVEMVEVTGGEFWVPYGQVDAATLEQMAEGARGQYPETSGDTDIIAAAKAPLDPIDLTDERLRKLAAALGPSYVRVSGSDANAVYFHDSDEPPPEQPPEGFRTVLTREQWKGVIDFLRAVDGRLVTSFAVSEGTRDADGNWLPDQARARMDYTRELGGEIAAGELVNEPNLPSTSVYTPEGYDPETFARDFATFRKLAEEAAPGMLLVGPSTTSEGVNVVPEEVTPTPEFYTAEPRPEFDVVSYHLYGATSMRCSSPGYTNTLQEDALTGEWLARTHVITSYYAEQAARYQPDAPLWNTETGQASCGGDPWAATFVDTFRFLDSLGLHARRGVQVLMHNTLAVSEYALIDGQTMEPRPNYWGALLWRRLMGTTVLDSGAEVRHGLHLYAHCMNGAPGGVTLLAINNSREGQQLLELPAAAERYTLSADKLDSGQVQLNGRQLALQSNGDLPELTPQATRAGRVELAPATITFLAIPEAGNPACR